MEELRKPFQGVGNIIRFNWHFYVGVILFCVALNFLESIFPTNLNPVLTIITFSTLLITFITLAISFYIYDLSGLYKLNWLSDSTDKLNVVNINAGFDEISELLKSKYSKSNLTVLDFYDPLKHTEISIKRARMAYPALPGTINTTTYSLLLQTNSSDKVFVFFSAHEIRNENERVIFFKELNRILKIGGEIYVTEHLRDLPNFLTYNIGFFHFFSKREWYKVFSKSKLFIKGEQKLTPFITIFILAKYDITA